MDLQKRVIFDGREYTLWQFMFFLDVVRMIHFSKYDSELVSSLREVFEKQA